LNSPCHIVPPADAVQACHDFWSGDLREKNAATWIAGGSPLIVAIAARMLLFRFLCDLQGDNLSEHSGRAYATAKAPYSAS